MDRELKETRKTMYKQNEKINKEKLIQRNQMKILELKSIILEMKNSEGFDSRVEQAEERISKR